jgi:hypothetical protein
MRIFESAILNFFAENTSSRCVLFEKFSDFHHLRLNVYPVLPCDVRSVFCPAVRWQQHPRYRDRHLTARPFVHSQGSYF